jgi:hypothetical protein
MKADLRAHSRSLEKFNRSIFLLVMAGNLPPQLPPQIVFLHNFGQANASESDPTAYKQQVTFRDSGVNIPNAVGTVSGQMTYTDSAVVTERNNRFTITCMPLVADTPVLNIQQVNVEPNNINVPLLTRPSGIWQSDNPSQNAKQLDLVWCPVGSWHYVGTLSGGEMEVNPAIDANCLTRAAAMPDSYTIHFNGLNSGQAHEYLSNPFGQACRVKNFNSVNTVSCIPNCNTALMPFQPVGTAAAPNFVNQAYMHISGWANLVHEYESAVAVNDAPNDIRNSLTTNTAAWTYYDAPPGLATKIFANIYGGGATMPNPDSNFGNQYIPWDPNMNVITMRGCQNLGGLGAAGLCTQAACVGGFPGGEAFVPIYTDDVEKVYGQNWFNTYCYSLQPGANISINPGATGFFTGTDLPFPGFHPYDSVSHNANYTYDHQISFVTSMTFLVDKTQCTQDNVNQGYHVFAINNSEDSAMNPHFTSPFQQYDLKIGHCFLPFLNRSGQNLFHPGWPIPCHQIVNSAPQTSSKNSGIRSQHDFSGINGFNADGGAFNDAYSWCYNSMNRAELATGANIKHGTCDFPKNKNTLPGYQSTFFNFPQTVFPLCGWTGTNAYVSILADGTVTPPAGQYQPFAGGYLMNPFNQMDQYSNNWLTPFPEGVCSDGAFVYTGRMAVLMDETLENGQHTGNYTTPRTWSYTFTIPTGNYSANSLLYAMNKAINTPIPGTQDFPLYRYVNFRDDNVMCVATDYIDDLDLPWVGVDNPCQTPANRQNPGSIGHEGRIVSVKKGPNTTAQLGARNFGFSINSDGKLAFSNTFTVDSPETIATSTLANGVPSVYYLDGTCARSGADPPLWGDLGQSDEATTVPTQLIIDPDCWAQAPSVRMINILEASTTNAANYLSLGYVGQSGIQAITNSSGTGVTTVQYLPNLYYSETQSIAASLLYDQAAPTFPSQENFTGRIWSQLVVLDLASSAQGAIQNGIYFNPCGGAFLPGSTGIQIVSLCDGSEVEKSFWKMLGFDPAGLTKFFEPKYEMVLPVEGLYYNQNSSPAGYAFSKEAFCVSNESPWLFRNLSSYYIESATGYPASASQATQILWINNFLNNLPTYTFEVPYYISANAGSGICSTVTLTNFAGALQAYSANGWGNGILSQVVTYSTNCPLFCVLLTGLPDLLVNVPAGYPGTMFEQIEPSDWMLSPWFDDAGNLSITMNGCQKYMGINEGAISGFAGSSIWEFMTDGAHVPSYAAISMTDLIGLNPYNMHQAIPRPLGTGIYGVNYASCVYNPYYNPETEEWSSTFPIPSLSQQALNLWCPTYTGFNQNPNMLPLTVQNPLTGVRWWNGMAVTCADYELISGSLVSWPLPLSATSVANWAYEYPPGAPMQSICSKNAPQVLDVTTEQGGFVFSHRSFLRMVDQNSLYVPWYSYDVTQPTVMPVLGGVDYYLQSVTDAIGALGPRNSAGGGATFALQPAVPGNWIDIIATSIYQNANNGSPGYLQGPNSERVNAITMDNLCQTVDRRGWQVPIAGRVRCDQVAPYYLNSTPLQSERGGTGIRTITELQGEYGVAYPGLLDNVTYWPTDTNTQETLNIGAESRMIKFCTNLSISNSRALGYVFNASAVALAGSSYASSATKISRSALSPPTISPAGSGNYDPSDPFQLTNLFNQSYIAFGQFMLGNLNEDGMFLLRIYGGAMELAVGTYVDGCRARNFIPVAVQASSGLTNTISFNTSIPFDVAAQLVNSLNFEFYSIDLQPLSNIVNIRLLLTFTPTGQPTPEELAFALGAQPGEIQSQVPSQVNYAGPNSILAQPPTAFNQAGVKRQAPQQGGFITPTRPGNFPRFIGSAKSVSQ